MQLLRTEKEALSNEDILEYIENHLENEVPKLTKLWRYYTADNPTIKERKKKEVNNPDNRTAVSYGRKIVTTFTGYGYRPRYITYSIDEDVTQDGVAIESAYIEQLQKTFDKNREHIKTSRIGRNKAIWGFTYELHYIDKEFTNDSNLPEKAIPRFVNVDPREMVLLYDMDIEPNIKMAIRFVMINEDKYNVEVSYLAQTITYKMVKEKGSSKWVLSETGTLNNYYDSVPVVAYYMGDDMQGIINPVKDLIDDLDILTSGSMDEIERFANAYLRVVGSALQDPTNIKSPNSIMETLRAINKRRAFTRLKAKDDVTFLTKDLPTDWVKFLYDIIKEQIHIQSHVPNFGDFGDLSGVAVDRLMFDFENVVSTDEADTDTGLMRRIQLINVIYKKTGQLTIDEAEIMISHKRNMPSNVKEIAETSKIMKEAGFSAYAVTDIMPDNVIPDTQEELLRQEAEQEKMMESMMPDIEEEEPIQTNE